MVISDATSIRTAHVVTGILNALAGYLGPQADGAAGRFTVFPLFETEADIARGTAYLQRIADLQAQSTRDAAERQELSEFLALKADGMNVMLSASDSTKRLGLLKASFGLGFGYRVRARVRGRARIMIRFRVRT